MPLKNRIANILFWSVISAAFIGPGTITTAASAGAGYGYTLAWALLFSTVACAVLQEAAARLTLASGRNLGEAIRLRFNRSPAGRMLTGFVLISILLGCAAYEAGNILGAVAGTALVFELNQGAIALVTGGTAALLLWFGSPRRVARLLGLVVAVMGICFLITAFGADLKPAQLLSGALIPRIPSGSELLVIGLVGTTVVPYNLFLGSGIQHSQSIKEMRWSLTIAIGLGGIISAGVMVVGSLLSGSLTYSSLAAELENSLGGWGDTLFGVGLFSAGLSSALTAPLAASITARSILRDPNSANACWESRGRWFRMVWGLVLGIGTLFGFLRVEPIPAIVLAQALNGVILPLAAIMLLLMMNDARLLNRSFLNSIFYNLLMGVIVLVTLLIGLTNLAKAGSRLLSVSLVDERMIFQISLIISLLAGWPVLKLIIKQRRR